MDLYSLPKDMLVKLICTIREDTEKKNKDDLELLEKIKPYVQRCKQPNCESIYINNDVSITDSSHRGLYRCHNCNETCCDDHKKWFKYGTLCLDCFDDYKKGKLIFESFRDE